MSPKAFLQRYLSAEPLIFNERALVSASSQQHRTLNGIGAHGVNYHLNMKTRNQAWILICDTPLYQSCEDNLMFVLKQNEVSLMCSFKRLPRFSLIEDILDPSRNKFVIKFNSETTVWMRICLFFFFFCCSCLFVVDSRKLAHFYSSIFWLLIGVLCLLLFWWMLICLSLEKCCCKFF